MASAPNLVMMTFPQHWDGTGTLTLNVLLIPSVDPVAGPLIAAAPPPPSFAAGKPTFAVHVQPTVAALPGVAAPGLFTVTPGVTSPAADPVATFHLLQTSVAATGKTIGPPAAAAPVTARVRKALPPSYLAAGGGPPTGVLTTTDDDFGCEVRNEPAVTGQTPPSTISWGEIISYALRQPVLATKLGILYGLTVTLPAGQAAALAGGGWVFVTLAPADPWAVAGASVAGSIRAHAARIPPLDATARAVFAAQQFVVDGASPPPDRAFAVAEEYADGFAKLVHCSQPTNTDAAVGDGSLAPASDLGIQVGWDDEQVVTWHNDQLSLLDAQRAGNPQPTAPLGVLGYRVDVADVTPAAPGGPPAAPAWQSLESVTTQVGSLGTFTGELSIEPASTRPNNPAVTDAWLPRYFANWRGGSLCEPDHVPLALTRGTAVPPSSRTAVGLTTLLSYGHLYAFRVRLSDLTGGGPDPVDAPINPPPNATALQTFQRMVPPKAPIVVQTPAGPATGSVLATPTALTISRPLMGYPEILYTGLGSTAAARSTIVGALVDTAASQVAAIQAANAAHAAHPGSPKPPVPTVVAGLPDPDVDAVEIEVLVRHPLHDTGGATFQSLYHATRTLEALTGAAPLQTDPGTTVPVTYVDATNIEGWAAEQAASGPLLIPRGRDVQIKIRARLRADTTGYFAPEATPTMAVTIGVRAEPVNEPALLQQADANEPVTGYLFRRPANVAAPSLVAQLAEQLGVAANGNSLTSPPGQRVVFGASKGLRTTLSADSETLTFGATSDLLKQWVVAIMVDLERDWTWDGLDGAGFIVLRGGPTDTEASVPPPAAVGAIMVPRVLGAAATTNPTVAARGRTRLVFLDAVDPHEPNTDSAFPESLQHRWFVNPTLTPPGPPLDPADPAAPAPLAGTTVVPPITGADLARAPLDLRLPIAIPPAQVPAIASVGIALTPYQIGPGYASTIQRQRSLWVELVDPIDNQVGDALFARVLAHGADPLLYDALPSLTATTGDPPLALDPELVRVVVPSDTDDRGGINAMTQLIPSSTSNRHFLLPLPPGVAADDPELFGFYTYELRVGHAGPIGDLRWWSTANARFGTPLRVVGVQHPAPALTCRAGRYTYPPAVPTPSLISQLRASAVSFPLDAIISVTPPAAGPAAPAAPAATSSPAVRAAVNPAALSAITAAQVRPVTSVVPGLASVAKPPTVAAAQPPAASATPLAPVGPIAFNPGIIGGLQVVPAPPSLVIATAPYATPVLNGTRLVTPLDPPKTQMWFFVYGQVVQADGFSMRNVLLATSLGVFLRPGREGLGAEVAGLLKNFLGTRTQRDRIAMGVWTQTELATLLKAIHLPESTGLSVLAVELLPGGTGQPTQPPPREFALAAAPAASQAAAGPAPGTVTTEAAFISRPPPTFPFGRILRASPLTPIGPLC
ncbi:MAG TPA: hypothetical protein VFW71_04315 [Actinomycetota bacterium]|nr:hypothetical protein [Actinomycetota bacterium]